jgi:hypothetical protein
MGVILELIVWFFVHLIGEVIVGGILELFGRSRRSRVATNEVRSDIRAVGGRVYDIGTEWSNGTAVVSAGHITFQPTMGIVGSREIEVDVAATAALGLSRVSRMRPIVTVITLVTPDGRLEWAVDTDQLSRAAELLAGPPVA